MTGISSFKIGETVRSKPVGTKPAFVGVIVSRAPGAWHVRDDDGRLWHRRAVELAKLKRPA